MHRTNVQSEGDTSGHLQQQKPGNSSNLSAESSDESEMGGLQVSSMDFNMVYFLWTSPFLYLPCSC